MGVCFVHIGRTGGSTFRSTLLQHAFHCSIDPEHAQLAKIDPNGDIFGHIYPKDVPPSMVQITILREPHIRFISDFYYIRQKAHRTVHNYWKRNERCEWSDYMKDTATHNWMVKMLAGVPLQDTATEDDLDTAIWWLRKMESVCYTHRLWEGIQRMSRKYLWKLSRGDRVTNNTKWEKKHNEDDAKRVNALDKLLYEEGRRLFP